jgi:hypothetical protein
MTGRLRWVGGVVLMLGLSTALAGESAARADGAFFANLPGKVLLDNPRVLVRQVTIEPGQSTGAWNLRAAQLLVFIKGGVLKADATGRSTLWKDGRVVWAASLDASNARGITNVGAKPIMMDVVTLKPVLTPPAPATDGKPKYRYLNYPNIPGEDMLENDAVIVQRFVVNPGQWEGVHGHHPDMLYIHVKGGYWGARSATEKEHAYPDLDPDGSVGWMQPIDISQRHESRNVGREPIDLIWVTLKQ